MEIWIKLMSITIFSTMYLGVVTDPEAVKDNDFDEVVDDDSNQNIDRWSQSGRILKI